MAKTGVAKRGGDRAEVADVAVRERLRTAALDLFQRKGYAATTVREIVGAAGVTKPVLYYHFGNKEGIYLAMLHDAFAPFLAAMDPSFDAPGPARARIEALCERVFALFKSSLPVARLIYSIYYGPPQGAPPFDFDATHDLFQERLKGLLSEGKRAGEFAFQKTEDALWAVVGALNIAMEVELCHPGQSLSLRDFRRVLGIVLDGMAPKASPRVTGAGARRRPEGAPR